MPGGVLLTGAPIPDRSRGRGQIRRPDKEAGPPGWGVGRKANNHVL